jgi:hypothetical protein
MAARWHPFRTVMLASGTTDRLARSPMSRFLKPAALAFLALAAAGCASTLAGAHVQRGVDFTRFRTFDWGPADALPTGDARLDANPFFKDRMQGAVEKQLATRGLVLGSSGAPDLLIHYHATVDRRIDVNRVDRGYGYCYDDDCGVRVSEYEGGTLIVDIVDTRTNRVVWRGWAQQNLDGVIDNEERLGRMIDEAVAQMLEKFPRAQ